jgi:hypothetical protein
MVVVNNVVRCPPSLTVAPASSCNCNVLYPNLFENIASPRMPTATSDSFRVTADVTPNPVTPYSSYVQGFLGNYNNINPYPSVQGSAADLLQQALSIVPGVVSPVNLNCIDSEVNIISECNHATN